MNDNATIQTPEEMKAQAQTMQEGRKAAKGKDMKITQKMLREVKRHDRQTFHDEAWWQFQNRPETVALQIALHAAKDGDSAADIVASAQRYIDHDNR